jgi:hypothetical protein
MKNPNENIGTVCFDCGNKYLIEKQKERSSNDLIVTCWNGKCELCEKEGSVTSSRHFNYLKPLENEK